MLMCMVKDMSLFVAIPVVYCSYILGGKCWVITTSITFLKMSINQLQKQMHKLWACKHCFSLTNVSCYTCMKKYILIVFFHGWATCSCWKISIKNKKCCWISSQQCLMIIFFFMSVLPHVIVIHEIILHFSHCQ